MSTKSIVLDANILIRAVLGRRGRELILTNAATVRFFAPDVAWLYCGLMWKPYVVLQAWIETLPVAERSCLAGVLFHANV